MSIAVVAGNAAADPEIGLLAVLRWCPGRFPVVCAAAVPFARAGPAYPPLPVPAIRRGSAVKGGGAERSGPLRVEERSRRQGTQPQ